MSIKIEQNFFKSLVFSLIEKEAVELVKDAIEFCDGIPIVLDEHRNARTKSTNFTRK
jgi:hypothetical protein